MNKKEVINETKKRNSGTSIDNVDAGSVAASRFELISHRISK